MKILNTLKNNWLLIVIVIGVSVAWTLSVVDFSGVSDANLLGNWQRVSPPAEMNVVGSGITAENDDDMWCAVTAPRYFAFFKDGKYAADGDRLAGGDFAVVEDGVLRLQTIDGLALFNYTKNEAGQLILNLDMVDCVATYEKGLQ